MTLIETLFAVDSDREVSFVDCEFKSFSRDRPKSVAVGTTSTSYDMV